jgi:ABC-type siderophore export system fused ATPase/permease subunit
VEEKIFFEEDDVSVSNSRFIVNGQTFAMGNVTSVKTGVEEAKKGGAIVIGIIGLLLLFSGKALLVSIIIIGVGILVFNAAQDKYSVVLSTSSGENQALTSGDKSYIEKVVVALNDAIVSQG